MAPEIVLLTYLMTEPQLLVMPRLMMMRSEDNVYGDEAGLPTMKLAAAAACSVFSRGVD